MLRFLLLLVGVVAAIVWVEPEWEGSDRTLKLRLRESGEIVSFAVSGVRDLAKRALEETREASSEAAAARELAPVGAAPASRKAAGSDVLVLPAERLTRNERERLTRLVEEKLRQP